MVVRVGLPEHDAAGAVEELGAGLGERAVVLRHLAEHSQRERILVKGFDPAARQMRQHLGGIDRRKLLGEESARVVVRERPQIEQHGRHAVVVLDLYPVDGAQPVGGTAGKDKGRVADRRQLLQHGVDRASLCGGSDFIEAVDDDPLDTGNRIRRIGGAHERTRPDKFHAGLLAEPPGEHGLSQAGIAENHHRIAEREYRVLANDRLLAVLPLVRERSFYSSRHR